jgi:hypothetical protein
MSLSPSSILSLLYCREPLIRPIRHIVLISLIYRLPPNRLVCSPPVQFAHAFLLADLARATHSVLLHSQLKGRK